MTKVGGNFYHDPFWVARSRWKHLARFLVCIRCKNVYCTLEFFVAPTLFIELVIISEVPQLYTFEKSIRFLFILYSSKMSC